MLKRLTLLVGLLSAIITGVYSQHDALYNQYMFNYFILNPAYAGSEGVLNASLIDRHQWVGIDGAPNTMTFSTHFPTKKKKVGLGMYVFSDNLGATNDYGIMGNYSYSVETGKGILSFGVQGGIYQHHIDWNNLDMEISDDPVLFTQSYNDILPDANFGVYYYTKDFYIGASSKHLFEIVFVDVTQRWNTIYESLARHFYLYSGKKITVNPQLTFEPSVLLKWVENENLYFDLNLMANYHQHFNIGVSYRSHVKSLVLLMQIHTNNNLSFGYSYDTYLGEVKAYSLGSHEFTIRYTIDVFAKRSACNDFE